MNRDDDQQLWDLLGKTAEPRVSSFFGRNILRQIREEPRAGSWFRWRMLVPAFTVGAVVIAAGVYLRNSPAPEKLSAREPQAVAATETLKKAPQPLAQPQRNAPEPKPPISIESQPNEAEPVAKIDGQDYEVVANLDDLLVLYETSLWDENSSL